MKARRALKNTDEEEYERAYEKIIREHLIETDKKAQKTLKDALDVLSIGQDVFKISHRLMIDNKET